MSVITNVHVYGFEDAVVGSKYPMSTNVDELTGEVTQTVLNLAKTPAGAGEDQFLTGITVMFDLTISVKAWTEAERYRFLYFVSSQSTMHRIAKFDLDKQCNEYVTEDTLKQIEMLRNEYMKNKTEDNYLKLLYNIPVGFKLTAKMTTNYRELKTIYKQRKNHRLPEWREFCEELKELPYAKEFICGE